MGWCILVDVQNKIYDKKWPISELHSVGVLIVFVVRCDKCVNMMWVYEHGILICWKLISISLIFMGIFMYYHNIITQTHPPSTNFKTALFMQRGLFNAILFCKKV
jgi:hypothetical protein